MCGNYSIGLYVSNEGDSMMSLGSESVKSVFHHYKYSVVDAAASGICPLPEREECLQLVER